MEIAKLAILGLVAAALACAMPAGECDAANPCPVGLTCHPRYGVCYAADPAVSWESPSVGAVLTGASAVVEGAIAFNGPYELVELSVGRPDVWQPLAVGPDGRFSALVVFPTSDGATQPFRIRITEPPSTTGRTSVSSIYRAVDNVAPQLSFSEPRLRPTPTSVRIVASEPLATSAPPPPLTRVDLVGSVIPGAWSFDGNEIRYDGLEHDATYAIDVPAGAVADLAGNATDAPLTLAFTTEPVVPASGQSIAVDGMSLTDFEVSSDPEGAVSLVATSTTTGRMLWGEFDSRSGLFRRLSVGLVPEPLGFQPVSAPIEGLRWPDGTSRRASGFAARRPAPSGTERFVVYADVYGSAPRGTHATLSPGGLAYVPGPSYCGQPPSPGTLEISRVDGLVDFRNGAGTVRVPAALAGAIWTLFQTPAAAEWTALQGGALSRYARTCTCSPPATCTVTGPTTIETGVSASERVFVADTEDGQRVYVFNAGGSRTMRCFKQCAGSACTAAGSEGAAGTERSVANRRQGSLILQAEKLPSGDVVLSERSVAQGCPASAPVELGRVSGEDVATFRPAMFGRKPGLLYISAAAGPGVLKTFIP